VTKEQTREAHLAHLVNCDTHPRCLPCRGFTPQLAKRYLTQEDKDIEVVFVSSDKNDDDFNRYFGTMPWLALPFSDQARKEALGQKFGVRGIPTLVVLDNKGNTLTTEGRGQVGKYFGGDDSQFRVAKMLILLGYAGPALLMKYSEPWVGDMCRNTLLVVAAIHFLEFLVMFRTLRQDTSTSMVAHFKETMLYGFFYWTPIKRRLKARAKKAAKKTE